jgi:2-pyrone-4,6-dicarboxylate lactonase
MTDISSTAVLSMLERPSRQALPLPAGTCDAHVHIFEPSAASSVPKEWKDKAVVAPFASYRAMQQWIGFDRAILVQPSAYGRDCSVLLSVLAQAAGALRAVVVKDHTLSDREAQDLRAAGVRGLRFNDLVKGEDAQNVTTDSLPKLAPLMREMGWHAQIYATCDQIADSLPVWRAHGVPLIFDHLARIGPPVRDPRDPVVRFIANALADGDIWIKLTAYRNSSRGHPYEDVRPVHDALVRANPARLVWGSDWPFISKKNDPPSVGALLDVFSDWVSDETLRSKIFVSNAAELYGFDDTHMTAEK